MLRIGLTELPLTTAESNNLCNENIENGVSVVFITKRELNCQSEQFLKYHFSRKLEEIYNLGTIQAEEI